MAEIKGTPATEETKVENGGVIVDGAENKETENTPVSKFKTTKQVCNELLATGAKKIANIRVRSSIVTNQDNYDMVSLSLETAVPGYVADGEGVYHRGETRTVFASTYALSAILKESDDTAWAANQLTKNPKAFEVILAGSKIDIIQEDVTADVLYKNPFSQSTAEGSSLGHDTIISHVVKIELCANAKKMLNMMAMSMMGLNGF